MTYVTEQTAAELRAHMRRLQKMPGWHNPLDDRLFAEILKLDAAHDRLKAEVAELRVKAARYEWLRTPPNNLDPRVYGVCDLLKRGDYLDAAIDAAIAAMSQEKQP